MGAQSINLTILMQMLKTQSELRFQAKQKGSYQGKKGGQPINPL